MRIGHGLTYTPLAVKAQLSLVAYAFLTKRIAGAF